MEDINLGEKISLRGFADNLHRGDMAIVKKMAGHYLNSFEKFANIEKVEIGLKVIHDIDKPDEIKKYEIKGKVISSIGVFTSEALDENMFAALDKALKKLEKQLAKEKEKIKEK